MVPMNKKDLREMVVERTNDIYEDLAPQLARMIDETKHNGKLTDAQKNDEISLHMMGYVKSCTTEVIIETLSEILNLDD